MTTLEYLKELEAELKEWRDIRCRYYETSTEDMLKLLESFIKLKESHIYLLDYLDLFYPEIGRKHPEWQIEHSRPKIEEF